MKRKPIKIDWDELEEAFSTPEDVAVAFLDSVTGRVVLEGEGEDLHADDDAFGSPHSIPVPAARREDPTQLAIHPPDTERKIGWLRGFMKEDSGPDAEIQAALTAAIDEDSPARAIRDILNANPEVRDAWYIYRAERIQKMIVEWLAEHEIVATDPPPWKS